VTRESRRRGLLVIALALVVTAIFFQRALLSGEAFLGRDMLLVYYPLRAYWAERVLAGSFPGWYPFDGLGQPFVGMTISGAFHPSNLLFALLPLRTALNLNVLLCFPAACGGVYALARRFGAGVPPAFLGGLLFAFSGYLVSSTNNLLYLMAAATVPWALWGADCFLARPSWGRAALAGVFSALVLLAGDVQAFALTLGLLAALAFCRRARWVSGGALVLSALAASMVQLVPTWQVLGQARQGQQTLAQATLWSTHPLRLLDVLVGPIFARDPDDAVGRAIARRLLDAGQGTLWVDSLYVGLPAVVLAGVGAWVYRRSRVGRTLALCTALLVLLALGKHAFVDALAYRLVPFFHAFRYPEKWMAYVSLGLALGAAAGLQAVLAGHRVRRWTGMLLGGGGLFLLALAAEEESGKLLGRWMANQLGGATVAPLLADQLSSGLVRGAAITGGLSVLAAAGLLFARRQVLVAWLLPGCCFLALLLLNEPRYQLALPEVVETASPFLASMRGTPWRVLQLRGPHVEPAGLELGAVDRHALGAVLSLEPVTPALFGVDGANTYLPAGSTRVFDLSDDERAWVLRRAGLFSTRYLSVAQGNAADVAASGKRALETLPSFGYVLLEDPAALPRAYLARPLCVSGPAESLAAVKAHSFVPGVEVVVECTVPLTAAGTPSGEVLSLISTPERVALKVRASAPGVVVLNDAFYSGWRASVDGADAPILAANHAVRAVAIAAGVHEVVFSYRTPGLWLGLGLTLLFLLVAATLALAKRAGVSARAIRHPEASGSVSNLQAGDGLLQRR
jgi:hypothetical protein